MDSERRLLTADEEFQLRELCNELDAATGRAGAYEAVLDVMWREIIDASRIPSEYFESLEKVGSTALWMANVSPNAIKSVL